MPQTETFKNKTLLYNKHNYPPTKTGRYWKTVRYKYPVKYVGHVGCTPSSYFAQRLDIVTGFHSLPWSPLATTVIVLLVIPQPFPCKFIFIIHSQGHTVWDTHSIIK